MTLPHQNIANAEQKFFYDSLYQLNRAEYPAAAPFNGEIHSWTYDAIGNRLTNSVNAATQNYTYLKNGQNPLNGQRLATDGTNAYTYDTAGNTLTRTGFSFGYNAENRMVSISGNEAATYTYDYQGRRTGKTVSGVTTTYLYDGLNLIAETTGGNTSYFLNGPGIDEPLVMSKAGQLSNFSVDGLGSVVATNDATGTVTHSVVFDAWGSPKSEVGARVHPFTYTGKETGEAGFVPYRARQYWPTIGRFSQEDPVLEASSPYNYVDGDPICCIDPLGERKKKRPAPTPSPKPTPTPTPSPVVPSIPITKRSPATLPKIGNLCDRGFSPVFWDQTDFNPYLFPAKWSLFQGGFADECRIERGTRPPGSTRAFCAPNFGWAVGAKPFGWCVCCLCDATPTPHP